MFLINELAIGVLSIPVGQLLSVISQLMAKQVGQLLVE